MEDEDIKEILHEVLTELYYSKGKKPPLVRDLAIGFVDATTIGKVIHKTILQLIDRIYSN